MTAYLALGSNEGEPLENLRLAVKLLQENPQIIVEAKSRIYRTESVEGGGPNDFLNAAVRVSTRLSARELLNFIHDIEKQMGRAQPPRHGPRLIDIDILIFGDEKWDEPELKIPHPRMNRRAFVLQPLLDVLEGGWVNAANLDW